MADVEDDHTDVVDLHFHPYVRAMGHMVITFALCEAALLALAASVLGDEIKAVALLKEQDKERVLSLVRSIGLTGFDLQELEEGVEKSWDDKPARNRLIHDEWFPDLYECSVATRGLRRAKKPEEVFGHPR